MAGWLALAGLPILIHLLHRQRHRTMDWAAMRWLLAAMKKNQRWIRLEQWLLLALRTLIVALVVVAMMKPALEHVGSLFSLSGPARHHILVLDDSMSMQYGEGPIRRWERAKEMATSILDGARQGDLASVVVLGTPTTTLVGEASPYLVSVAQEIDSIRPQDGVARIEDAIEPVTRILKSSPASRRRVYLITDMQRTSWLGANGEIDPAQLARRLQAISDQAEVSILDTSGSDSPNVAVISLEQVDPLIVLGRPAVLRATIANFAGTDRSDIALELRVDGNVERAETIAIPAGQQKSVTFSPVFKETGDRTVEVRVSGDALVADNSRWLVARVRDALSVLAIDGEPSGEPFRSETDYLRVALSPRRDDGSYDLVRVESRLESDLLEEKLDDWDLVVLANIGQFTENEAKLLSDYARRGGGVLFFLGTQVDLGSYARVFPEGPENFFPVQLTEVVGSPDPNAPPFTFDPKGYAHPLIADFRDNEQAGLLTTRVSRYVKSLLPKNSTAEVALSFTNDDPAVVLSRFGQGTVGVVTTSADLDWNNWAISPSYVPVVQQLVQMLVAGHVRRDEVRVGETISLTLPKETFETEATISPPAQRSEGKAGAPRQDSVIRSELRNGIAYLNYADTDRAGVYRCTLGPPIQQEWGVAVNTWPVESDLTKLLEKDLRSLLPGWEFRMFDRWESDRPMPSQPESEEGSVHRAILYLVLGLVMLETVLAWRFGHYR